jgi:Na+-driven multidrug efflux pump
MPRTSKVGEIMSAEDERKWKRKWTAALVIALIVGLAVIAVLSFFLHEELND